MGNARKFIVDKQCKNAANLKLDITLVYVSNDVLYSSDVKFRCEKQIWRLSTDIMQI